MATLQAAKKELRGKVKQILSGTSMESVISQSAIVTDRLLSLPEYEAAQRLSVYLSMPSGEITTSNIVRDAFNKGKTVFVPYIYQKQSKDGGRKVSIMEMLRLRSIEDYESLQSDRWGIPSIGADTVAGRENCQGGLGLRGESTETIAPNGAGLDLIVVPGMAFDRDLRRLGHGKGYYDHFLNRCWNNLRGSNAQTPYLVALALQEQILPVSENIPVADHDRLVDTVIVGDGQMLKRES